MTERLSDEQVARLAGGGHWAANCLAREVQATRLLLNGGPCPTCGGRGWYPEFNRRTGEAEDQIQCPDCVDGRVPGVIERLQAVQRDVGVVLPLHALELAAVIADLREHAP